MNCSGPGNCEATEVSFLAHVSPAGLLLRPQQERGMRRHESHLVCYNRKMSQDLSKGERGWNDEYFKFYESNMN